MAKATLRQLLNKHKGVDTVKLKQKKHMKEVERKKTLKNEFNDEEAEDDDDDDDEDEDEEGGIMVFDAEGQAEEGFSADEESEEDEEGVRCSAPPSPYLALPKLTLNPVRPSPARRERQ